jgi:hypothetical protein
VRNRASGRTLRDADALAARASRLLIAERVRLNTLRTMAALFPKPVLSNVWLPLKLLKEDETAYKSLCLWWNSSLHILLIARLPRQETEGAWVAFQAAARLRSARYWM